MNAQNPILTGLLLTLASTATAAVCPPSGPHWGAEGFADDAELQMTDIMIPANGLFRTTYYNVMNYSLGKRGGYGGLQNNDNRPLNNIFSIWDLTDGAGECKVGDIEASTVAGNFGGEGTGLHTHNDMGWVTGQWYSMVLRRWMSKDSLSHLGFWMYDYSGQKWTHYATIIAPEKNQYLTGNTGGFVENFWSENGLNARYMNIREPWKMKTGGIWIKPTKWTATSNYSTKTGWNFTQTNGSEVTLYACGDYVSPSASVSFNYSTPKSKPDIALAGNIDSAWMIYDLSNQAIKIRWKMNPAKGPQLRYTLKLFKNNSSGTLLAQKDSLRPVSESVIPLSKTSLSNLYTEIQVEDIFGNTTSKAIALWDPAKDSVDRNYSLANSQIIALRASDQETTGEGAGNGTIAQTIDNNTATFWHSKWATGESPMPHELVYQLKTPTQISGIRWLNRQDNSGGYAKTLKLYFGAADKIWTDSMTTTLANVSAWQEIPFATKTSGSFVRAMIQSNQSNTKIAALAEIQFKAQNNEALSYSSGSSSSNVVNIHNKPANFQNDAHGFSWNINQSYDWKLWDLIGQKVDHGHCDKGQNLWKSDLATGSYLLQITAPQQELLFPIQIQR